jgi:homoserine kinase type II
MHIAGLSFSGYMKNPRGTEWRLDTANKVMDFLSQDDRAMLQQELEFQARLSISDLPFGVIHADLFRDNVLFDGEQLGGVIDFYYACNDVLLYDVAIAVNDWCVNEDGSFDEGRLKALLATYHKIRAITLAEQQAWTGLLRLAALRFWLSRLYDLHFPQAGELTHAKDPQHFQKVLKLRVLQPSNLAKVLS